MMSSFHHRAVILPRYRNRRLRYLGFAVLVLSGCLLCAASSAPRNALLLNAKTIEVLANVSYIEKMEERGYTSKPELGQILAAVAHSRLYARYRAASAEKADIIIKFDEDRFQQKISLSALDPEDNGVLYKESRDLVALGNDVNRLVEHFLSTVDQWELAAKQWELEANLPRKWRYIRPCVGVLSRPDCPKAEIWWEGDYLYKKSENGRLFCQTEPSGKEWTGSCTHHWWFSVEGRSQSCTVVAKEIIELVTLDRITGRSQMIDLSPTTRTPFSCPIPSAGFEEFTVVPDTQ